MASLSLDPGLLALGAAVRSGKTAPRDQAAGSDLKTSVPLLSPRVTKNRRHNCPSPFPQGKTRC